MLPVVVLGWFQISIDIETSERVTSNIKAKLRNEILWELEIIITIFVCLTMACAWLGHYYHRLSKMIWEYLDAEHTKLDEINTTSPRKGEAPAKGE